MRYETIYYFTDLQDNSYPYHVGDLFPRQGLAVSPERLEELSGSNNKQGRPLIKAVAAPDNQNGYKMLPVENACGEKKIYTEAELNEMKVSEIRELAQSLGFKCSSISRVDIIAEFMQKQQG